jgi:hypothetical protein
MPIQLRERTAVPAPTAQLPPRPASVPDPGYDALPRLTRLRDQLTAAVPTPTRSRWKEPPVFFFDRKRQADFEAVRPVVNAEPFAAVSADIAAELPLLYASAEVRRVARAVDGLRDAADALAAVCPAARDLAELLAIPDDEVFVVLHPQRRAGFRLVVRGVADVGQFHILMADAVGEPVSARFVAACRDVNPTIPAGVPMVADAQFQMYTPAALRPDGTLPAGFGGCEHWLWPATAIASVPRLDGERVVLLGPPAYGANWDVTRRFQAMPAEVRLIEALGPLRVAERLARELSGRPVWKLRELRSLASGAAASRWYFNRKPNRFRRTHQFAR